MAIRAGAVAGADTATAFRDNLTRLVNGVRERGGVPVLMTPPVRRLFSGTKLTSTALHVNGQGVDLPAVISDITDERAFVRTATLLVGAQLLVLAWFALAVTGAADSVSTIIRNTIRQLQTPDHIRGRMTSVNQIFFQGGPQLGEVEAGVVAQHRVPPVRHAHVGQLPGVEAAGPDPETHVARARCAREEDPQGHR